MVSRVRAKKFTAANATKFGFSRYKEHGSKKTSLSKGLKGYAWVNFLEDPIFNDYLFNKFIGLFVKHGKKEKIFKIIYSLFGTSEKKRIPYFLFFNLLDRLKPGMVCVPTRYGRVINFIPMPTTEAKAYRIGLQYLYKAIRDRKHDTTLEEKIFNEFEACFKEDGYTNIYWKNNSDNAELNSYLRHFRRFGVY